MEEIINQDFLASNLVSKIKQEPKDEEQFYNFDNEDELDNTVTKSLILRFVKDKNGNYSVVPLIKPDPFFEENLEDLSYEDDFLVKIKSEDHLNYDKGENFTIKQEKIEADQIMYPKNEKEITRSKIHKEESDVTTQNMTHCPKCLYTNKAQLVKRHIQRVHTTTTKHSCPFCNKRNFKEHLSLDSHILRNHGDTDGAIDLIRRTIFKCTFCCYKTLKRNNFRRHLTTHGEGRLKKRLEMTEDRNSSGGVYSNREIRRALSTTKYDCFHCPYMTKDKGSIIKHLRLHKEHTLLPFTCKVCKKKFNEKNSLDSHIVKRHIDNMELLQLVTNRVYECELCNYKDVNKNKVIRHKKARHVKKERKKKISTRMAKLKTVKNK